MDEVKVQRVDGKLKVRLPEGVTAQDFADWLNCEPNRKALKIAVLPERWDSAGIPEEWRKD